MFRKTLNIKRKASLASLFVIAGIISFYAGFNIARFVDNLPLRVSYESLNKLRDKVPKMYVVYSGSMSPSLSTGSLIAVKPEIDYFVGDVVSFRQDGGQVVTHRISKVIEEEGLGVVSYETKGDANNTPDRELVKKEQILGEVFFALPYLGYSISFLKTKTGFIVFAIIPAVLIILGETLSIKNEINKLLGGRKKKRKRPSLLRPFLFLIIAPLLYIGASNAYFSDREISSGNVMSAGTWGEEEWDKSSLYFDEDYACQGDCNEISAKICNEEDSEDMQGPTTWELYWIESGNPKDGVTITSGLMTNALEHGTCQILYYNPGDNSEEEVGNYKFKAYQRPGHPGLGELWSETCEILQCEVVEN